MCSSWDTSATLPLGAGPAVDASADHRVDAQDGQLATIIEAGPDGHAWYVALPVQGRAELDLELLVGNHVWLRLKAARELSSGRECLLVSEVPTAPLSSGSKVG